jgi:phosphogluconate dehydratase
MLIGALSFGHLPTVFVPAGPMPSGLPNSEKSRTRQRHAAGEIGRDELLASELASYHEPGTCTFYGTANSNQLVVEAMGLHLPGASFVNPGTDLRRALTVEAGRVAAQGCPPIGEIVDERTVVNGVVALLATGGSTNHTMHLVAVAAAAGIQLTWDDFADLSAATPLLARIYPNGAADINQFHAAGGVPFVIGELLDGGLMHPDVDTVAGHGLGRYRDEPYLDDQDELRWRPAPREARDGTVLRGVADAFAPDGGIRVLDGALGRAVMKVSAVAPEHRVVTAPARVFDDQGDFLAAFDRGELDHDLVAVIRHQGPRANGMPELHKLTPALGVLMDRGHRVALVTDGRMSGASGKVPAALHCTPEAAAGGPLSRLRDGDVVRIDAESGRLEVDVDLHDREPWIPEHATHGTGRELFAAFRQRVGRPDEGASVFADAEHARLFV